MTAAPPPPGPTPAQPSLREFLVLFASLMLPMFLAIVDQTIVAAALPAIAADLGSPDRVSWVVISYLVAQTIAAPVYGQLGDTFGRRRLMFVALGVMMVGSILCGVAQSVEMLTAARVLQGLGGGGLMTLSQALIGEALPPRTRARYQGFLATVGVTSNAFGAVAGGFLTQHFGWRSIFFVGVPIAAIAVLLVRRLPSLRQPRSQPFRFDMAGLFFFAAFIASALVMLHNVQHFTIAMLPLVSLLLVASIASVAVLIWWERRIPTPLLPISLLRSPIIWRSDALAALHGATFLSMLTFLPIYLRVVHGAAAADIGLLLLPVVVGVAIGSMLTGSLVSWSGRTTIFPSVGLAVVVVAQIVLALLPPDTGVGWFALVLAIVGLFMGTVMGVVQVTVQSAAGPLLGAGAASVQFSRSLGAAFGTALVGVVLFSRLAATDPQVASTFSALLEHGPDFMRTLAPSRALALSTEIAGAFRTAFLVIAAMAAAALLLAWSIPQRRL